MRSGRIVLGLCLAGAGVLALLDRAGTVDAWGVVATWWPVSIMALGMWQLAYDRRATVGSGAIITIGFVILAFTSGAIDPGVLRVAWPMALVGLGVWILLGRPGPRRWAASEETDAFVAFGSREAVAEEGATFTGGAATVLAGQLVIDLTAAIAADGGAELSATVLAGGLDVVVPPGWEVRVTGLPLLGGWDNTTRPHAGDDAPLLRIKALVVAGGIEVKYRDRWR